MPGGGHQAPVFSDQSDWVSVPRPGWMSETLFDGTDVAIPASVSTRAAPLLYVMGQAETPVDLE